MQTLRLFADVARCHSFSEAARLHGITQSAASQRISQLEKRLDAQLIDRSVRPLELTDAGRLFLQGCQSLIEHYDELEQRVRRRAHGHADGEAAGARGALAWQADPVGDDHEPRQNASSQDLLSRIADTISPTME